MKFACVVLYTKTGKIWDGAKEKPNYLCDSSVIDAASLGAWTSALGGQHIPMLWLKWKEPYRSIYHNHIAPRLAKSNYNAYSILSRLLNRAFSKFHNLKYLTKFDVVLLDMHDYGIQDTAKIILELKKLRKRPMIMSVVGDALEPFREKLKDEDDFRAFKAVLDSCDVFYNYLHEEVADYLSLYTDTPIVTFPMFYPFEFTKSFFVPREGKKKTILVVGHTQRTDHVASQLVAKRIQEKHPEFLIEVVSKPGLIFEPLKKAKYKVIPSLKWHDFLKHLSKTFMVIDMDSIWTLGRVPADAATVGTPCIGVNSIHQKRLFPDLTCRDVYETTKAVDFGIRLIEDRKFYGKVQGKAFKKLGEFSYKNSVKRFNRIMKEYARKISFPLQDR